MKGWWIPLLLLAGTFRPAMAQDELARGRYLAVLGDCAGCHSAPHGASFAGGVSFTAPFGTLYSTNITPDAKYGIGSWSRDDFYRALHEGIAKGGRHLYPAFPYIYFTNINRADSDALYAFLRSQKPVAQAPPPDRLHFPFNIRAVMIVWNWLYRDSGRFQADSAQTAEWNRGAAIVNGLGHCGACHTPKNFMFADKGGQRLAGGLVEGWYANDIRGGNRDGLARWSVDDIAQFLATGRNRFSVAAGTMQEKVSSSTSRMTDADRKAIAVYLKSLSAGMPPSPPPPGADRMKNGEAVFVANCAPCHAAQGGSPPLQPDRPDYPKLAGDTLVLGRDPTTVIHTILEGAQAPSTANDPVGFAMPAFATLSDTEIADVATYIRNSGGNRAPAVSSSDVRQLRRELAGAPRS